VLTDITLRITPQMLQDSKQDIGISRSGHLGTHFDVMDKEFPLAYTRRRGIVFDVSAVRERDICIEDVVPDKIEKDMFVAFYTGFMEEAAYGSAAYFADHPQLSEKLTDLLLEKGVSVIAVDCAGIRRGKEHIPADRRCADRGTFVVENLCNLRTVLELGGEFTAHTYPMHFSGVTGVPCRVIAETE